jgi:hypothetical protein
VSRFGHDVEHFCEKGREVVVLGIDCDPAAAASPLPELAWLIGGFASFPCGPAHFESEPEPEAKQGLAAVLALGAALRRLGGEPGGFVSQDDGRFHLVSVLSPGSRPARGAQLAGGGQSLEVECGGIRRAVNRARRSGWSGGHDGIKKARFRIDDDPRFIIPRL